MTPTPFRIGMMALGNFMTLVALEATRVLYRERFVEPLAFKFSRKHNALSMIRKGLKQDLESRRFWRDRDIPRADDFPIVDERVRWTWG